MRLLWEGAALRSMCQFSCVSGGGIFSPVCLFLCAHTSTGAHIRGEELLQSHWDGFQSLLITECCSGLGGLGSGDRKEGKGPKKLHCTE